MSPKGRKIYNIMNRIYTKIERFARWFDRWIHPYCRKCKNGKVIHFKTTVIHGLWTEVYKCDKCGELLYQD